MSNSVIKLPLSGGDHEFPPVVQEVLLAIVECECYISDRLTGNTGPTGGVVVILVPMVLLD
ncbi:hypothetical protein, partial [Halalkalicoccus salilacus]|uniref:hypothetical protein n=1 Tax=Halalkalicoccus sp. GCM10025704 TaxID=3252662 RepID=UPI0036F23630